MKRKRKGRSPVSHKISKLRHEAVPQEQAVATALSMKRAHRLGRKGGYRRVHRKGSRRSSLRRGTSYPRGM